MKELLHSPELARRISENGRKTAREHFNIQRFARDWDEVLGQF